MTTGPTQNSIIEGAHVPDGGWGWMIVFASFMIHFIMDGITYSIGDIFLQPMRERLNSDRGSVSLIFGLLPAITLSTGPIATIFTNRYGCRQATIIGSILAALGFFISSLIANLWLYYVAIGIMAGLGFGLIYLPAIVSVGFYFEKKRSFAMGIAVSGSGLGTLAFPWLIEYIIDGPLWFDYDGALLIESATIFIGIILGLIMIPLPQEPSEIHRMEKKARSKARKTPFENNQTDKQLKISVDEEQRDRLIQSNEENENNLQIEEINSNVRQRSAVVPEEKDDIDNDVPVVIARKDSLYQGSLNNIPMFQENPDEYQRRVVETDQSLKKKVKSNKNSLLVELSKQIDLNLLKDLAFAWFALSNFLTSLGFNVPYNFAKDLATDAAVPIEHRTYVIQAIGISNCFGRLIIGYLADRSWINRLFLYNSTLIIAGLATILAPFSNQWVGTHLIYSSFFGFFSGGYVGLTSVIVVDLVGVDKLSDAFGTLLLFQGVAVAIGTPITGYMREYFSDLDRPYLWPYLIFGGSILISGLMLFFIPIIKKYQESRRPIDQDQIKMGVLSYSKQNLSQEEKKQEI